MKSTRTLLCAMCTLWTTMNASSLKSWFKNVEEMSLISYKAKNIDTNIAFISFQSFKSNGGKYTVH